MENNIIKVDFRNRQIISHPTKQIIVSKPPVLVQDNNSPKNPKKANGFILRLFGLTPIFLSLYTENNSTEIDVSFISFILMYSYKKAKYQQKRALLGLCISKQDSLFSPTIHISFLFFNIVREPNRIGMSNWSIS